MIAIRTLSPYSVTNASVSDIQRLLAQLSEKPRMLDIRTLANVCTEHTVLVAIEDAIESRPIVGMATLIVIEQLVGTRGRVEDVVVDREFRGQGIGRKLMEELHMLAVKNGVSKLALSSRPGREEANKLYASLGYAHVATNVYVLDLEAQKD